MEEQTFGRVQLSPLMRRVRTIFTVLGCVMVSLTGCFEREGQLANVDDASENGMAFVPGGTFWMGAQNDPLSLPREHPAHLVTVGPFWMDAHEVTNAQFDDFVQATGYVTVAEKPLDIEALMVGLPLGSTVEDLDPTPGSMVFSPPPHEVGLADAFAWWDWQQGADWRHPFGPESSLANLENHPVVHVCYWDALAYAEWCGKRLPTEAEWEWAARGGLESKPFPWGDMAIDEGPARCNIWSGRFPVENTLRDGHYGTAPTGLFPPNGYGLFDMAGNVWEICSDWYDPNHYATLDRVEPIVDPRGPDTWRDPSDPTEPKRVMRGGSFLCNESYCSSYRVTARMAHAQNTGMSHVGFRCVQDAQNSRTRP